MVKRNISFKQLFIGAVLWIVFLSAIGAWLYAMAESRQARREVIYLKARNLAAEQRAEERQQHQRRMLEEQLRREYSRGHIAGNNGY